MGKFQKGCIPWNKDIPRTEETKLKISIANKGKIRSEVIREKLSKAFKGRIYSKEHNEKISKARKGMIFSEEARRNMSKVRKGKRISPNTEFKKGQIGYWKGKHLPEVTKEKISKANEGKYGSNNPNWKGGISSLEHLIRTNFKSRQWRSDVFTRDNFTCQICGDNRGHNLNAHHIKSFSKIIQFYEITTLEEALECEELWNINNGITLCEKCHNVININLQ